MKLFADSLLDWSLSLDESGNAKLRVALLLSAEMSIFFFHIELHVQVERGEIISCPRLPALLTSRPLQELVVSRVSKKYKT